MSCGATPSVLALLLPQQILMGDTRHPQHCQRSLPCMWAWKMDRLAWSYAGGGLTASLTKHQSREHRTVTAETSLALDRGGAPAALCPTPVLSAPGLRRAPCSVHAERPELKSDSLGASEAVWSGSGPEEWVSGTRSPCCTTPGLSSGGDHHPGQESPCSLPHLPTPWSRDHGPVDGGAGGEC